MRTFEESIKDLSYIDLIKRIAKYNEHIAKDKELLSTGKSKIYGFSSQEICHRIVDMQTKKDLCVKEIQRRENSNTL